MISHAEGYNTMTGSEKSSNDLSANADQKDGSFAHAEGNATLAKGKASHSEGQKTFAAGPHTHSEGYNT